MQSIALIKASDESGNASVATVQNTRAPAATTLQVDTVQGIPTNFIATMGTPHTFTDPVTGETITIISEATAVDFAGHVDGTDLEIDEIAPGYTDGGSEVGDIVIIRPTTAWSDNVHNVLAEEHKDDGKHADVTADSLKIDDGTDVSVADLYQNAIINSACMVAQRAAAPSLTNAYLYGKVDMFAAKGGGTAVSAGTIDQNTSSLLAATKGYEIKLAGVTLTGTGIVYLRYRMEAKDAMMFKNAAASFSCRLYHDVGSAKDATIYIRKANAADDFSAVTDIANSGAISVPNTTATELAFENINSGNLGDCSNGLEIEIQIATGAITTRNFYFAEFQFTKSNTVGQFQPKNYNRDLLDCCRYLFVQTTNGTAQTTVSEIGYAAGTGRVVARAPHPVPFRIYPTITATGTDWQAADGVSAGIDGTGTLIISIDPAGTKENVLLSLNVSGATSKSAYVIRGDGGSNRTYLLSAEL